MKIVYFFILLLSLIAGCVTNPILNENWERVSLPQLSETTIDSFKIESVNNFPVAMIRKDSLIIIKNNKSDSIFRVFLLPKFKYLGWFGRIGKGPNEFIVPPQIRLYNDSIQISGARKILIIDLPTRYVNNNFLVIKELIVPGLIHPLNEVFTLNDDRYYGIVYGGREQEASRGKELVYFNYNTYAIGSTIDFPTSLHNDLPHLSFLYHKHIAVSPKNDMFAFFYYQYPLIRIFDANTDLKHEIWVDGLPKQIKFKNLMSKLSSGKKSNLGLAYGYYGKVISTEKYLYAMFCNDKGVKTVAGEFSYDRILISNPELHVFTWEGEPVYRIQLQNGVSAFELSDNERYLYVTNAYVNDKIYRYDLKQLKESVKQ